jgi:hypothetical protein
MAHRVSPQGGRQWPRELGSINVRDTLAPRRQAQFGPTPLTRARARLRRSSLDRALARGEDPCESSALAHRAARLTSERSRQRLAAWIEEILARVSRPARSPSVVVEPDRDEVWTAAAQLARVRELLRSDTPVYARGVAMLERVLSDGGSALYLPVERGQLSHELVLIIAALQRGTP